ncbi:urease accessory protein UreE [Myroides sp. LJL119]
MLVTNALYNDPSKLTDPKADILSIEWFQANKRIQRLTTCGGQEVAIRFFGKNQELKHGDVLWEDQQSMIVIQVEPTQSIVVRFDNELDMSYVAYQVGNKHIALFVEKNYLLIPFERPIYKWLLEKGFDPELQQRVLVDKLNANVDPTHNKPLGLQLKKPLLKLK